MRKKIRINIFCVHGHKYSRKYISLFVLDDDLAQTDLATYRANQAYLIMAHRERERVRNPPSCIFCMEDKW